MAQVRLLALNRDLLQPLTVGRCRPAPQKCPQTLAAAAASTEPTTR